MPHSLRLHVLLWSSALVVGACTAVVDATDSDDTDAVDTLGSDTGSRAAVRPEQVGAGWLSVSEVLRSSAACPDLGGWTELRWSPPDGQSLTLEGLVVAGARASAVLPAGEDVSAGARLVLTPSLEAYRDCYGVDADVEVDLPASDVIVLSDGQRILDQADLGTATPGAADSRDDAGVWCLATTALGDGDLGTPGAVNPACGTAPDTDDTDPPVDTDTDTDVAPRTAGDLVPGELHITEFMPDPGDVDDRVGEYIELRYDGTDPLDLFGLEVADATTTWTVPAHTIITPGRRILVARDAAGLNAAYGIGSDASSGLSLNNDGGDTIRVGPAAAPLDTVDFRTWRTVRGAAWERDPASPTRWCVATDPIGATTDRGTPGRTNRSCTTSVGDTADTGDTDTDAPSVRDVSTLVVGELRIVELMANPFQCTDPSGEYVEVLLDDASEPVDVFGLQVGTQSGARTTVGEHVIAAPGVPLALLHASACYTATGAPYTGIQLVNTGGLVTIGESGRLLDEVAYTSRAASAGVSWQRDADDVWCLSTDLIPGSATDHGTPGAPNVSCTSGADTDITGDTGTAEPGALGLADIPLGLLRISEVLADPVGCADAQGEFVEVFWTGAERLDLRGLVVSNAAGATATVSGTHVVEPLTHVALHRRSPCGSYAGIEVDGPDLDDAAEVVRLRDPGGRLLDEVVLAAHVNVPGVAWQRDDELPSRSCAAVMNVPGTIDRGTPGGPNTPCQADPAPDTDTDTPDPRDTDTGLLDTSPIDTGDTDSHALPDTGDTDTL